ncbi:DUF6027 family protein [Streptomyces sp. WP-1]|uniref:DUF6027 family protein n=1 Tax=Streptomyces sp. WP-1 TaxID=3041497 RepID=UPI00264A396A|nr:DUF6027 family protein [Streptomyces sp. WP-1]WKE68243.1 DUF6027 family protein [Streptomyces sp. WP-1]
MTTRPHGEHDEHDEHDEPGPQEEPVIRLHRWDADWPDDDPHANFKSDVVRYGRLDPLATLRGMAENLDIPRSAPSPAMCRRAGRPAAVGAAGGGAGDGAPAVGAGRRGGAADSDSERLRAYHRLRRMIAWLRPPLDEPRVYPARFEDGPDDTTPR